MIAGYYDNNGYPNMYTGPTNGGVVPVTEDPSWSTWMDGNGDWYPNNPLIASHDGLDGRVGLGSIDDYWVTYDSAADDPYITGSWTQHAWDSAIGDYMKTSQSAYNNTDGGTHFYNYTGADAATKLTCADMPSLDAGGGFKVSDLDGTYGRKLFYEAKGYTVTDCFNQNTDNNAAGGFSFANYKAQIDANRPVLLNLAGHSVVGVGYNDTSNTVYIHDTWDASNHTMTWGGSYSGMNLMSVSIVSLSGGAPTAPTPKTPAGKISDTTPTYTWTKVAGATQYRYKLLKGTATIYTKSVAASACGATTCTNTPTKILAYAAYKWAVQANVGGVWTSYSPYKAFTITNVPTPKAPTGAITDTTPKFTWTRISGATQYQFSVYKSGALKYTKTVANAACGSNAANCSNTPTTVLAAGGYTWKVKAYVSGAWRAYSAAKSFTVSVPSTKPKAGLWKSTTGDEFYVTPNQNSVDNFAIYLNACGTTWKITHTPLVPISNKHFSFTGAFYASGTFNTTTKVTGQDGLNNLLSPLSLQRLLNRWAMVLYGGLEEHHATHRGQRSPQPRRETGDNGSDLPSPYHVIEMVSP